jgi:hypothetical protein
MRAKTALGAALVVLAAGLAGGGIFAARSFGPATLDPETLCPAEGAKTITLILIDRTDPLTPPEQERARQIVGREREAARRGDRIVVEFLAKGGGEASVALKTVADLCNPGSEANPFFENPKRVAARYESAFLEPVDAALASVAGEESAPESPIARSIEAAIGGLAAPRGSHIKLILISDLMEHGAQASAYTGALTEKTLNGLMPGRAKSLLEGAEVEIALLQRPKFEPRQRTALDAWRRFFLTATGRPASLLP